MEAGYGAGLSRRDWKDQLRAGEVEIELTKPEVSVFHHVGGLRITDSMARGWNRAPFSGDWWTSDTEGAGGEMAVAKWRNVYYEPIVGDPTATDVAGFQVRTNCSRTKDDMVLRPIRDEAKRNHCWVSVLSFPPKTPTGGWRFIICGWVWGYEVMIDEYLGGTCGTKPGDAWWVRRDELHPLSELPNLGKRPKLV